MNQKIVFVSSFDYYEIRMKNIIDEFVLRGDYITYITSDFDHISKKLKVSQKFSEHKLIHVPSYSRNLSSRRIYSHIIFSKKCINFIRDIHPDIIYALIPPNSLVRELARYKKNHPKTKLIFDIFDMWPESLPFANNMVFLRKFLFPWRRIRDNFLYNSDMLVSESKLFISTLIKNHVKLPKKQFILPLFGETEGIADIENVLRQGFNETCSLCYLGSINSIIDIDLIVELIEKINWYKPVVLHIIGDGETREKLLQKLSAQGVFFKYYGKVFDSKRKRQIIEQCDFGLNLMKNSVCVGLTMKSISYYEYGLPLINSIRGDTWDIIEENKVGININQFTITEKAKHIANLDLKSGQEMKARCLNWYRENYSVSSSKKQVLKIVKSIVSSGLENKIEN